MDDLLTKEDLSHAMELRLDVTREVADENAEYVLDLFGFHEEIIDNVLEPEDRQLFYQLQESGLLTTRSEETILHTGQTWRSHYWLMRADRVHEAARLSKARATIWGESERALDVYADLPPECWNRK